MTELVINIWRLFEHSQRTLRSPPRSLSLPHAHREKMLGDFPCVFASTTDCKCPTVRLIGRAPHPPSWSEKRARSVNLFDANKVEECLSRKLTEAGDYGGSEVCGAIYHKVCRQALHKFPAWCGCLQGGLPAVVSCTYCDPDIDTDCSWRMPLLRCAQSSTQRSMSSNLLHQISQNGCWVFSKSGQTPTCSPCANATGALPPENIDKHLVVHPAGAALLGGGCFTGKRRGRWRW